jgi:aspartate/methionine/tyrosine aminotransferase
MTGWRLGYCGGPKEIVVAEQDLARAQEILAAARND